MYLKNIWMFQERKKVSITIVGIGLLMKRTLYRFFKGSYSRDCVYVFPSTCFVYSNEPHDQ